MPMFWADEPAAVAVDGRWVAGVFVPVRRRLRGMRSTLIRDILRALLDLRA